MAVHSAIVNGAKQVCDVSNKEMLELMEITDEVRKQIGKASTLQQGLPWLLGAPKRFTNIQTCARPLLQHCSGQAFELLGDNPAWPIPAQSRCL